MPDQSDVAASLAAAATDALYPNGPAFPSALGVLCRVFRGFPTGSALEADLAAGRVDISVMPVDGSYRNTTRYMPTFLNTPVTPTLTVATAGNTVVFAGVADPGQLAGVLVDGRSYVYRTTAADSPATVAANLAVMVRADRPATLSGQSVYFPGAFRVVGRTVADTPDTTELRRQTEEFRVSVWAPSAALRDAAGALLDATLAAVPFLDVADTACRLLAGGSATSDKSQSAGLYRRDLLFSVEYPTTAITSRPAMLFGTLTDNGAPTLV